MADVVTLMTMLINSGWIRARDLEGVARHWDPPPDERLRRAHRGTHPFGHGLKTHTPNIFYTCKSPNITYIFFYLGWWVYIVVHVGVGGRPFPLGVHGIASHQDAAVQLTSQLDGQQRVNRVQSDIIRQLELLVARLQTCIDQTFAHLDAGEQLAAQETLETELSPEIPFGMGVKKAAPLPILYTPVFEHCYVFIPKF